MSRKVEVLGQLSKKDILFQSDIILETESEVKKIEIKNIYGQEDVSIIYEFKIDGMTCVACSQTIEGAMKKEFTKSGLQSISIALLTHKMRMEFDQIMANQSSITSDKIVEEVEMVGFGAELLDTIINNQRALLNNNNNSLMAFDDEADTLQRQNNTVIKVCSLIIEGMTCASCQQTIEAHLRSLKGVESASVSLLTHKTTIQYKPNLIGIRTLIEEVEAVGFSARYEAKSDKADIRLIVNEAVQRYRKKFFTCLALQIPILILMWIVPYTGSDFPIKYNGLNGVPVFVYLTAFFATIIQIFMGYPFYINSYKSLRNKSANMDVLIALGTSAAWLYGIVLLGIGYHGDDLHDPHMYKDMILMHSHNFEISSVLITIILLGKFLESITKKKTVDKLSQLASLKVTKAFLIQMKDNAYITLDTPDSEIEVELLQLNDLVKVYPGGQVPIDGVVLFGKGIVNESMLTGEARPINKDIGSKVYGGTTLLQGNIIVKVTKTAENSSINQIIKLVENAQNSKAPIQGLADTIAKYFVPCIIILAILTWIVWFAYAYSKKGISQIVLLGQTRFQFAFDFGISTLVIACPCALGLATPTAVMVGTGVAATYGILIKGGDILEKINSITTIVFDKTGTLTSGTPLVRDLIVIKDNFKISEAMDDKDLLYYLVYMAEQSSEHPLGKAIIKRIKELIPGRIEEFKSQFTTKEFKNRDGEGVVATLINTLQENEEWEVLCGNEKLMRHYNVKFLEGEIEKNIDLLEQEGMTVITLAVNRIPQLIVCLEEEHIAKAESREVVRYLRKTLNLRVAMITGDNQHSAFKVAKYLGIDQADVTYKAYPEDKKKAVERFQAKGEKVMFVGDGINDSPVLAQAEVGVAINSGSDITVHAAGIVLMKDNLYDVVNAIRISKKAFRRIKINFGWAFIYNLLLVPIAMGLLYPINGFKLDPIYAGGAMALSSISVVVSSLMLRFFTPLYDLRTREDKNNEKNNITIDNQVYDTDRKMITTQTNSD